MMAGLLFARAGIRTVVLEKHADFLRDFRGDTVHPSTMEIMSELGLIDRFLAIPHQRFDRLSADFNGRVLPVADFRGMDVRCPFVAFMPQWDLLDFLADEARAFPDFSLLMKTEGTGLLTEGGRIIGVEAHDDSGPITVKAELTIAADGRRSILRGLAGLRVKDIGAPIDVLWFRLRREGAERETALLHAGAGGVLVTIDRGDYWQCAHVIPKGGADRIKAVGLDAFRRQVGAIVPSLSAVVAALQDWDQVKLLSVTVDRLETWHRPGLVCIGDAAHAMSPIGGVGINLAVQDAVAAANLFAAKLAAGDLRDTDLPALAARRSWPVRAVQFAQVTVQNRVLAPLVSQSKATAPALPLGLRLVSSLPFLQRLVARAVGLGLRPEHVRSPRAVRPLSAQSASG